MLNPTILRSFTRKRFDTTRVRIDSARLDELARTRGIRAARLLGRATPYDLKTPWLTLRPDRPIDSAKGRVEYVSPSSVGLGQFEDGSYMFAAFDLIFRKDMPGEYSVERPQVSIRLTDPPAATMLVEIDLHAHDWPPGDPAFEVQGLSPQTITIPDGRRETIMLLMHDFLSIQSVWAEGDKFWNKDGSWAFFEARITPID